MGNLCEKLVYYSDKKDIEVWLPDVVHLFNYDTRGMINSMNSTFAVNNVPLVRGQMNNLLTLLRGRLTDGDMTFLRLLSLVNTRNFLVLVNLLPHQETVEVATQTAEVATQTTEVV